jgi:LmbE family N-acetylglucosaminyl deacetylase
MNPYEDFVEKFVQLMKESKTYPLGGYVSSQRPPARDDLPKVMLFSPHPDDECLTGALPLRLMRELNMNVINVPVTYGAKIARRHERYLELNGACQYLGFRILEVQEGGLVDVSTAGKQENPRNWSSAVGKIADAIRKERPFIIFVPHDRDFNTAHVGTHELVLDSLRLQDPAFDCYVAEWEYWAPMETPNLLIEVTKDYLIDLITAVSFHVGEVKRNPQHTNLPAWMHDNVRRGSELVAGQGHPAPDFEFGMVYRLRRWKDSRIYDHLERGRFVSSKDNLLELFDKGS